MKLIPDLRTRLNRTGRSLLNCYITKQQDDFVCTFAYRMGISKAEVIRRALNIFMFHDRRLPNERIKKD